MDYEFLKKACEMCRKKKFRNILLQIPSGIIHRASEIATTIEEICDLDVIIQAEPVHGACCIPISCGTDYDCVFHIGHRKMLDAKSDVFYIPYIVKIENFDAIYKSVNLLEQPVELKSTCQYSHISKKVYEILKNENVEVINFRKDEDVEITGCKWSFSNSSKSILFFGSGKFHSLGMALYTNKKVICADLEKNDVIALNDIKEKTLRKRFADIEIARNYKNFGILVSTYPGQYNIELANKIKTIGKKFGKKMHILMMKDITQEIDYLDFECYVSTACPRIALDDSQKFKKIILNPDEFKVAVDLINFESIYFL